MANVIYSKKFKYYMVYKTTCLRNNKTYIGCHATDDLDDGYLGSGSLLKKAVAKYGKESFSREIIQLFDNPIEMFAMEKELVNEAYLNSGNSYNLVVGGSGGFKVQDVDDWKAKLKEGRERFLGSLSAEERSIFFKTKSDKAQETITNRPESLARRANSGKRFGKGEDNPMYGKSGELSHWYGKSHTPESIEKMKSSLKQLDRSGDRNPAYGNSYVKGRKWFHDNNGTTFYLFPDDPKIVELSLISGRLPRLR